MPDEDTHRGSFCGLDSTTHKDVRIVVSGPGVAICNGCAAIAAESAETLKDQQERGKVLKEQRARGKYQTSEDDIRCSFCAKRRDQVRKMIVGASGAAICDECFEICTEILDEEGLRPRINEGEPTLARLNVIVHRLGNFYFDIEVGDNVYVHSDEVHHAVRYALDSIRQNFREGPYEVEPP